ncbi:hypothetical protein VD0004_g3832 [Verticillium dahliae]|uniref:Cyclin N-terminal domain-containing protein n=1 Tax=Verticillium dahliae TaxID=27337 RepID=A0A444S8W2_VERDA|nr:hypothetical protein VD0004_g3832 [Verticillium dahliae]PNH73828.1 hypothetical protein VD0001_g3757 [Verticillium dahliae]RXG49810.1 hypothetical protein VDGE_00479 [Verticillium dahliae]
MGNMARDPAVVSDDDYEVEDMYFTYRPLSNLPTPPLSSRNSSADHSPKASFDGLDAELLQDKYLGPAVHLINLVPTSASLRTPSTSAVQSLLARTALPLESIALASCILDSLNSKFALAWRLSCPLIADPSLSPSKRHSLAGPFFQQRQMHIDSVQPELIILAALVIAAKFTEDQQDPTAYYCASWGRNIWSCEQLNVTERCICENLNWRIKPLADDEDLITETLVDMQLAARHYRPAPRPVQKNASDGSGHSKSKSMSVGTAVVGLGLQLTPVDTPVYDEDGGGSPASDYLSLPRSATLGSLSPVGEES